MKYEFIMIIVAVIAAAALIVVLAIVLPKKMSTKLSTKYDLVKKTKMENFKFLNENFSKKNQTVLVGDSITEIFNSADLFENYIQETGVFVYNRGISGDTSDRMLERMETNVINIKPRNLVILIGTNDKGKIKLEDTVKNIKASVQLVQEKSPETHIVLEAIYPVNPTTKMVGARNNKEIMEINKSLEAVAKEKNIIFLDLTNALSDKKGVLKWSYCYDGLHLNAQGFAVVAEHIIPLLK